MSEHSDKRRSELAHTDHPLRHFDRTCPACIAGGTDFIMGPDDDEGTRQGKHPNAPDVISPGDSESTPKPQTSYVPLTEEQIDELRRQAKAALDPDHLPGRYDKRVDTLCDMAVNCLLYGEELERLRSAPYSWARRDAVESASREPTNELLQAARGMLWLATTSTGVRTSACHALIKRIDAVLVQPEEERKK